MQNAEKQLQEILSSFNISYQQVLGQKFKIEVGKNNDDDKKTKKKNKKFIVEETDSNQVAIEKVNKMIEQFSKNYEAPAKYLNKIIELKKNVDQSEKQRDITVKQRDMIFQLHKGFKTRYEQQLKKAQQVQKQEQIKRKQVIEQLQQKIKTIQSQYEEAGKLKIQKYRENETLKHETLKLQPHFIASQSLYEAQLKKKAIEIEIQMTTLKQKIQMMDNFKGMKSETLEKIQKAKVQQEKINLRLKKITEKEDEHKILLAKAHLIFEDYKKAIHTLKNTLPKRQKQALEVKTKCSKAENSLKELKKQLNDLDTEFENQIKQKQVLQALQNNLIKQLQEAK